MDNVTKEILINVVNWYESVNDTGTVTIDDLADLKPIVESVRGALAKRRTAANAESETYERYCLDFGREANLCDIIMKHEYEE